MKKNRIASVVVLLLLIALAVIGIGKMSFSPPVAFADGPTALPIVAPLGPYPASVGTGALNFVFTAADASNGNSLVLTGHEILLATNTDSASHTITFSSAPDQYGRTADIATYALAAGDYCIFNYRNGLAGWKQSDGTAHVTANSADIEFAVIYVQ